MRWVCIAFAIDSDVLTYFSTTPTGAIIFQRLLQERTHTFFSGLISLLNNVRIDDPTPAYSPVSDRRRFYGAY
jgi:hypothetical protein